MVWKKESIPDSWRDTVIVQLNKSEKNNKADITKKRNIHTKSDVAKVFGHIVTDTAKPTIVENMTPYQIGALPGHRAEEHIFTLKSIAALAEKNNTAIAVNIMDLSLYFDKESFIDMLN